MSHHVVDGFFFPSSLFLAFGSSCLEDFELGSSPLVIKQLRYKEVQSLLTEYHLYILHDLYWFLLFLFSQRNKPEGHPCGWVDILWGALGGSDNKESACSMGDLGLIPGSGRSSGEGNGNPL